MTYDQSIGSLNWKYYLDGTLTNTANKTGSSPTTSNQAQALRLGKSTNARTPLEAELCEFAIFSRVLTSDEISSIYSSGNGKTLSEAGTQDDKATLITTLDKTYPASGVLPTGNTETDWSLVDFPSLRACA